MQALLERKQPTAPTYTIAPPPTLADLHRRYNRANVYDLDGLQSDVDRFIAQTLDLDEATLDELAGIYAFIHENMEREGYRYYTREDWIKLERQHIEKARYTKPDLFDDILTAYERGELTEVQAKAAALQYRECRHVFCLNVFKGRKDQRYCSDDCRYRYAQARKRAQSFPFTTLPPSAYKDNRDDTDDQNYYEHERSFTDDVIAEVLEPADRKKTYGGKRNRAWEDKREIILDSIKKMK